MNNTDDQRAAFEAFRYNSEHHARMALKALPHKWPEAKVLATLEDKN